MKELAPERRRRLLFRALPRRGGARRSRLCRRRDGRRRGATVRPSARRGTSLRPGSAGLRAHVRDARLAPRAAVTRTRFRRAYAAHGRHGHARGGASGGPDGERDGRVVVPVVSARGSSGVIRGRLARAGRGQAAWTGARSLTFPGLGEGEALARRSRPPRRAALLASRRRGARPGPGRRAQLAARRPRRLDRGPLEPATARADRPASTRRGFPRDWPVGRTGSSARSSAGSAGRPGGELLAGGRVLARAEPRGRVPCAPRSTPACRRPRWRRSPAGSAASRRSTRARARSARSPASPSRRPSPRARPSRSLPPPPRSRRGAVKPSTLVPGQTGGRDRRRRARERQRRVVRRHVPDSFAHSCNSVFAPLGVKLGRRADRDAALRYGWNAPPPCRARPRAPFPRRRRSPRRWRSAPPRSARARCCHPAEDRLGGADDRVGRSPPSSRRLEAGRPRSRARDARGGWRGTLDRLMRGVVDYGTGTAAAVAGIRVAGKTGHRGARGHARAGRPGEEPPPDAARTPTPGSRPTRRHGGRASRWRCCSCGPGRAADTAAPAARLVLGCRGDAVLADSTGSAPSPRYPARR